MMTDVSGMWVGLGGASVIVLMMVFGLVVVWIDQRGKTRQREIEHTERMKSLELGRPLQDAPVARAKALGNIGVAVPVTAFVCALLATAALVAAKEVPLIPTSGAIWGSAAVASLVTAVVTAGRLKADATEDTATRGAA
jgi:hypothetical protein